MLVHHAADAAVSIAGNDRVADPQRSALNEHGSDGAAATVEVRLDGNTLRVHVRVGAQIQGSVGRQQHCFEQCVDVETLLREMSTNMVSPPYSSAHPVRTR